MALSRNSILIWRINVFNYSPKFLKSKGFSNSAVKSFRNGGNKTSPEPKAPPESLAERLEGIKLERPLDGSCLIKPALFTLVFSSTSLACASLWQYENLRARRLVYESLQWFNNPSIKYGTWRKKTNSWWNDLSEGEKIFYPICFLNGLVFLAWRVPGFQVTMARYFFSNPAARNNCWPMILSSFSHYSTFHIFANMYVLHSFSTGAVLMMGKEQFVGFYLTAAAVSSFSSNVVKVLLNRPGFSLGASGAIMGVLSYTCMKNPDSLLNILFLPMITFKAGTALKAILAFDTTGIVLRWKLLDHAAHLGGALFGIFWAQYGHSYMLFQRRHLYPLWHKLRNRKPE